MSEVLRGNPLMLSTPDEVRIDRVLDAGPRQKEDARYYPFYLKRLEGWEVLEAQSRWDELMIMYKASHEPMIVAPTVNGKLMRPSSGACQLAAYIETAQRNDQPKWTAEQIFLMMLSGPLLVQMNELLGLIQPVEERDEDDEANMSAEGGWKTVDPLASSGATS